MAIGVPSLDCRFAPLIGYSAFAGLTRQERQELTEILFRPDNQGMNAEMLVEMDFYNCIEWKDL
jgi:hypothetical protein